jgi:hypothetical protein
MRTQRFSVIVGAGSGGRAIIVVPFDPDEAWARIAEVVDLLAAGIKERPRA